jgi:hypothetical protein
MTAPFPRGEESRVLDPRDDGDMILLDLMLSVVAEGLG